MTTLFIRNPIKRAWIRLVARLLWLANTDPPDLERQRFYAIKNRLLHAYGRSTGHIWQRVSKRCWWCHGDGIEEPPWVPDRGMPCERCNGTGEFDHFWVRLSTWDLAGFRFHRPEFRQSRIDPAWRPRTGQYIDGRIEHARVGYKSLEACLWLILFYDRRAFVRGTLNEQGWILRMNEKPPKLPLTTLARVVNRALAAWTWIKVKRCILCKKRYACREPHTCRACHADIPF
jgi:hypothetical protein